MVERRLKEYNGMTGKSKNNIYKYLFTCEVKNMTQMENAIKEQFSVFASAGDTATIPAYINDIHLG